MSFPIIALQKEQNDGLAVMFLTEARKTGNMPFSFKVLLDPAGQLGSFNTQKLNDRTLFMLLLESVP